MATITMRGIARLARVQRPVVSMWRTRSRGTDEPFPSPVRDDARGPLFDADAVAVWLIRTGRGNNPDAALDAAAYASPAIESASTSTLSALLTLRELHGAPIGALDADELQRLAADLDPDDTILQTEVAEHATDVAELARHVDAAVDADYTASAALARMLEQPAEADRSRALSASALELVDAVVQTLVADVTASTGLASRVLVPATPATPLIRRVIEAADADVEIAVRTPSASDELRMLRRVISVSGRAGGVAVVEGERAMEPAVHVLQLPATGDVDAARWLSEVDDVAVSMTDDQRAVVIGPSTLLVDALRDEPDRLRANTLRLGRVRAIARLPRGCALGAPRARLALWVLGPSQGDVPAAERTIVTIDLDGIDLADDVRHDVLLDVAASLGTAADRHHRAFRFGVPVTQRSLLGLGRDLVPPRLRTEGIDDDAELVSRFLEARARVATFDGTLASVAPIDSAHAPLTPALLGDLVRDRVIRRIPGNRIPAEAFTPDDDAGYPVIDADLVRGTSATGRSVDRLRLMQLVGNPRLTEPGDVIVVGGDRPAAIVDPWGASVVEAPAAILRVDLDGTAPVEPALLQHDIARFADGDWRSWPVRRLAASAHDALRSSMADVARHRRELVQRLRHMEEYERALVDGFVAGVLAPDAEHPRKDDRGDE